MDYQVLDVKKFIGKAKIPFEVYDRNGQPTGEIVEIDIGAMVESGKIALQYIERLSPAFKTYITKMQIIQFLLFMRFVKSVTSSYL